MFRLLICNAVRTAFASFYTVLVTSAFSLVPRLVAKQWIELNPGHIGLCDVGDVAACTLGGGRLRRCLVVRHGMVAKREEAPAVSLGESLAVLHGHIAEI